MRAELLTQNVERLFDWSKLHLVLRLAKTYPTNILGPLVDDVELGISLDEATWRGTNSRAHVRNEEATIWLSTNLICNG